MMMRRIGRVVRSGLVIWAIFAIIGRVNTARNEQTLTLKFVVVVAGLVLVVGLAWEGFKLLWRYLKRSKAKANRR